MARLMICVVTDKAPFFSFFSFYFLFQPVLHDWCNKGHGMCYPVWDGAYKRTLAINQPCSGSGFPLAI